VSDGDELRRHFASLSDVELTEEYARGEASYQAAAWPVLVAEVEARKLEAPAPVPVTPLAPAPAEDPEGEAALEALDRAYHPRPLEQVGNPVVRLWRGEVPLWFAYWVLFIGGVTAWRLILVFPWPRGAISWLALAYVPYVFIVSWGLFSSAETYKGPYAWIAPLVKLQAALGIIGAVAAGVEALSGSAR